MTSSRLFSLILIVITVLFCTVRIHAQNAQVSPVSNLSGSNSSVINNNEQILQTGINGILGLFSQYFSGGILNTSAGGTGKNSSNWPINDIVYMSALGTWGHEPLPSSHGTVFFPSSGTWTAPTGITTIFLTILSGGGNGGNASSGGSGGGGGGGGGSGALLLNFPYTVTPGNTYTVTIAAGGSPTVFDILSLSGGSNGTSASGSPGGGGGAASSGGTIDFASGGNGGNGAAGNGAAGGAGGGATSYGGGGSAGGAGGGGNGGNGGNGSGYGSGGGGAGGGGNSGSPGNPGSGTTGFIIVQY